jgi:hypothetical protein
MNVIGSIEADTEYAKFQWRTTNQWINGELSRSQIQGFFAGNAEDSTRKQAFTLDADEPPIASGQNRAPFDGISTARARHLLDWNSCQSCSCA